MGARKQYRGSILCFLILVVVLAATALLVRRHRQPSPPAAEALTVAVDPEQVEEVAIYWNYLDYAVSRDQQPERIEPIVSILNGTYAPAELWDRDRTGSGNYIEFFDGSGQSLGRYSFFSASWAPDTEFVLVQPDDWQYQKTGGPADLTALLELGCEQPLG